MSNFSSIVTYFKKPWLWLPTELSYKLADFLLATYSLCVKNHTPPVWNPVQWKGLYFPNPLGPAGGFNKHAQCLKAWWTLGAGFIEIGTITPLPQKKNPGITLKRNLKQKALWNHLGFPGPGLDNIIKQLKKNPLPYPTPVFANIGKNRTTPNHTAHQDYIKCITELYPHVDGFIINISSPNTKDLCQLAKPTQLKPLLQAIQNARHHLSSANAQTNAHKKTKKLPILIKWSPDLSEKDFRLSLDTSLEHEINGHILSNSTASTYPYFPKKGGVSGQPLAQKAKKQLILAQKHLGKERANQLLISTGGILTIDEVFERLEMGADLVQTYSALVFQGPLFFKQVHKTFQETSKSKMPVEEKSVGEAEKLEKT